MEEDEKKAPFHPEHLRYLARQCKQLLIIRKNLGSSDNQAGSDNRMSLFGKNSAAANNYSDKLEEN